MTKEQLERGLELQKQIDRMESEIHGFHNKESIQELFIETNYTNNSLKITDKKTINVIAGIAVMHKEKEIKKLKEEFEKL